MGSKEFRHFINYLVDIVVLSVQGSFFALVWFFYYRDELAELEVFYYNLGYWAVVGVYGLFLFFFTKNLGGFRFGYNRIVDVSLSQLLSLISTNIIGYIIICIAAASYLNIIPMIIVGVAQLLFVLPVIIIVRIGYRKAYPAKSMLIIYGDYPPELLIRKLGTRYDHYNVSASIKITENLSEILECIPKYETILLCDIPAQLRNDLLKYCYEEKKRTYIVPKISDIILMNAEKVHLFDSPLYLARNQRLSLEQRVIKRGMDIILSVVAIVVSSPFLTIFALLIKIQDKGPIFYTQERLTRGGRRFQIMKFRSMRVDAEKEGAQLAQKRDPRITSIGRFLRATHLDELPQIFNIFIGDMSFVGPRPERPEIVTEYLADIPEFNYRLGVKAGLTGFAQVFGKYNTTPYDKLKLDIMYIENYSVWLDIKLLLMTFRIMFEKENTEGIEPDKKNAL